MSAAEFRDHVEIDDDKPTTEPLGLAPDAVEVRRNAGLAALVGAIASGVAIAYLARASNTGAPVDWALAAVMGALGVAHLAAFVDARTPLLVADTQGVRIRLGNTWRGLPWGALARVEHRPRRGVFRDGRLVLVVQHPARLIEELDRSGRRQSKLSQKLYGAPFAVPLALSTRVNGAGEDLTAALTALAGTESRIVVVEPEPEPEVEPEPDQVSESVDPEPQVADPEPEPEPEPERRDVETRRRWRDPRPAIAHLIGLVAGMIARREDGEEDEVDDGADEPVVASATPSPLRDPVVAQRAEIRRDGVSEDPEPEGGRELRRPGSVNLVEDTQVWGDRVSPIARPGHAVEPLMVDDYVVEPAEDPVVGPQLVAARTRLGLTVDRLAERTRIRPHVIESIEVDDFAPCGGDFYARGHLRTLARVLGIDVTPLLTAYDERYADAPINPRRVFEAELATGSHGSIRGTRGGPNWSVLVAAVMGLVLVWSIARLVMDSPADLPGSAPVLNGSAGVDNSPAQAADPVPVVLTAAGGGARVVVRDGTGRVAFIGNLTFGETKKIQAAPPVRVQSSDGSLEVGIAGESRGALGSTGEPAQNTFTLG
jgi:hypothetical protein